MELRQLRYFVALAEELHFGRAAAREHIGQSSLSQQLQRLERELGVVLLERTTHHVRLTAAGAVFLIDARQVLAQVDRAVTAAQRAASSTPSLRVGIVDASYDSMPLILAQVQLRYPELEIHQVEVGVPDQFQRLLDGRLDVGIGRATLAPPAVAAELFRLDPLGVLVARGHPFASASTVPVAALAGRPRAYRRRPGSSGGRWFPRRHGIRGRCCGGPVTPPSMSGRSSTAPADSPAGSAGWNTRARRRVEHDPAAVIGGGDKSWSGPSFPRAAGRGYLNWRSASDTPGVRPGGCRRFTRAATVVDDGAPGFIEVRE